MLGRGPSGDMYAMLGEEGSVIETGQEKDIVIIYKQVG